MMRPRFYAPDAVAGKRTSLPADEARHVTRVLRLKAGAGIIVFDGRGREFDAVVETAGRSDTVVRVGGARTAAGEPRVAVTLAQAVLKGEKMDDVVRDAVMMGVAVIQPMVATRSEVTLASVERGRRRDRWARIAISSAKQCGRAVVPAILDARTFRSVLDAVDTRALPAPALIFVEPSAGTVAPLSDLEVRPRREATILIGPEGGWTPDEIAGASASCRPVTLGTRTLRADAMPVVALSALFTLWREF